MKPAALHHHAGGAARDGRRADEETVMIDGVETIHSGARDGAMARTTRRPGP